MTGLLAAAALAGPAGAVDPDEVARCVSRLRDADFEAREAASRRLLDLGAAHPEAVLALLPAGESDPEAGSRLESLRRRIPSERTRRGALAKAKGHPRLEEAVEALCDRPSRETLTELAACGEGRDAVPGILGDLLPGLPREIRPDAIQLLGLSGGPETARLCLPALLGDADPACRAEAVNGIGQLGDLALAGRVAPLLRDPNVGVAAAAASCLGILRDPATVPPLREGLADPRGAVRFACAKALCAMGERWAAGRLVRLLDDPDWGIPASAAVVEISGGKWDPARGREQALAWWREHERDPAFAPPEGMPE